MEKKTSLKLILVLILAVSVSGCYTTGLSSQERGIYNYSNLVYGLYENKQQQQPAARIFDPQGPIKLGVAQVGEHVPSPVMMESLKKETQMFAQVTGLPLGGIQGQENYYQQNDKESDVSGRVQKLCSMAEDMGLDYVFLYGGSAEVATQATAWSLLDLTIVGAYVVPSRKVQLEINSVGVLIDVKDRRPIVLANTNHQARSRVAAIQSPEYYGGGQEISFVQQKNIAVSQLATEFVEKMKMYF